MDVLLAVLSAFTLTAGTLHLLLTRGRALPMDRPNERSLHQHPTPRIGGLAIVPVILLVALIGNRGSFSLVLGGATAILFAFSALDDRGGLPVRLRFLAHLGAATAIALHFPMPWFVAVAVVFGLTWMTNLYNFMDGANGLAGGMSVVGFGAYALAASDSGLALWAACCAAAALAFLLFNFDPARIFMGDAGSIPLGFLAGALGLWGIVVGNWPWWFPLLVFAPFIGDASLTLSRRILRREPIWRAHREHYYQRVIQMGWSHRRLALAEYLVMASGGTLALIAREMSSTVQHAMLASVLAVYVVLAGWVDRRWQKRSVL